MVCTPLYAEGCLNKKLDTPPPIFGFPKINFGVWCRIFVFRALPPGILRISLYYPSYSEFSVGRRGVVCFVQPCVVALSG